MTIKVMIVEDEKVIREGLKTLLEDTIKGYTVLWEAPDGVRALEIIEIEVPDLVITDVRMPKMNGIDFIRFLNQKYKDIPILIISGYDDYVYVREALKLGVDDYLLKPISRYELASTLSHILENKLKKNNQDNLDDGLHTINEIKKIIKDNLEKELSLEFISHMLGLHPNYISNLFSKHTKGKLSDYISEQRILKAKELLMNTNLKVYDIAFLSGYTNPKYFSSVFKKKTGHTPQTYRLKCKSGKSNA